MIYIIFNFFILFLKVCILSFFIRFWFWNFCFNIWIRFCNFFMWLFFFSSSLVVCMLNKNKYNLWRVLRNFILDFDKVGFIYNVYFFLWFLYYFVLILFLLSYMYMWFIFCNNRVCLFLLLLKIYYEFSNKCYFLIIY